MGIARLLTSRNANASCAGRPTEDVPRSVPLNRDVASVCSAQPMLRALAGT